jgi:hypothetical protein
MMKSIRLVAYVLFSLGIAVACYLRPLPDDFDRYVYEALVRSAKQPIADIYRIVKHESPRAEASTVMDSPEHLGELEPLYAIRPLYVQLITLVSHAGVSPQASVNLVSAASLLLIALLVCAATQNCFCSALVVATPAVVTVGRMGTPDALSSLAVVAGCVATLREKLFVGILLLMVSIWMRTDNLLVVLAVLVWLVWNQKLSGKHAGTLAALGIASVVWINALSGNFGWKVLFRYSFISGKYPAEITPQLSLTEYAHVFVGNAESIAPQLAPWLLLVIAVWSLKSHERGFLLPVISACALHYVLFPSGEARYFTWAYLLTGILFIRAVVSLENRIAVPFRLSDAEARVKVAPESAA